MRMKLYENYTYLFFGVPRSRPGFVLGREQGLKTMVG